MFDLKIIGEDFVVDEIDTKSSFTSMSFFIDEENEEKEIKLVIKNKLPQELDYLTPKNLLLIINISPSVFLTNNPDFNFEVTIQNSENLVITSDKLSYEGQGYVGILFSSDEDVILNYENNNNLIRKILLVPFSIRASSSVSIIFRIKKRVLENTTSIIRNKFFPFTKFLYDTSKSYIWFLENEYSLNLSEFYTTYGRDNSFLLLKQESLIQGRFFPKDFFFLQLMTNTTQKLQDGSADSVLLNYEKNVLSNYFILNVSPTGLLCEEFTYSSGLIYSVVRNNTINSFYYLKSVAYLFLAEFLKPYLIGSGFAPTNTKTNLENLISTQIALLNRLSNFSLRETIVNYTSFSGNFLDSTTQKVFFVMFYLLGQIMTEFVSKLIEKQYLSSPPRNIDDLTSFLNNRQNLLKFLEYSKDLGSIGIIETETLEVDFIFSVIAYLFFANSSGKNIFTEEKSKVLLQALFGYYEKLAKTLHLEKVNIDPNTETLTGTVEDEKYFNKIVILSILSSMFLEDFFTISLEPLNRFQITNISSDYNVVQSSNVLSISLSSFSDTSPSVEVFSQNNQAVIIYPGNISTNKDYSKKSVAILASPSEALPMLIFDGNIFDLKVIDENLVISHKEYTAIHKNNENKLILNTTTKDLHANLIHIYLKLLGIRIEDTYFITSGGSSIREAFLNLKVYNYLKVMFSAIINNKVAQNIMNIKFILSNTL